MPRCLNHQRQNVELGLYSWWDPALLESDSSQFNICRIAQYQPVKIIAGIPDQLIVSNPRTLLTRSVRSKDGHRRAQVTAVGGGVYVLNQSLRHG